MPPPAMAATAAAAMAHAAPKKPWRYYYVMVFPLGNALSREKLTGMLELTAAIERHEDEYLLNMVDRESAPEKEEVESPLARYVGSVIKTLSALTGVLALASLACIYRIQITSVGTQIDARVLDVAYGIAASIAAQNAVLFAAVAFQSPLLLRGVVLLLSLSIGGAVFLLDELGAVQFTQRELAAAIEHPRDAFTDREIELVLNGGLSPSLWHRFFVDGPSWFLVWLERHCARPLVPLESGGGSSGSGGDEDDASAVDHSDFFTPLWQPDAKSCARSCLSTHIELEQIVLGVLTGVVVVLATQLALSVLLVWLDQFDVSTTPSQNGNRSAVSRKRKRQRQSVKHRKSLQDGAPPFAWPITFAGVVRLASLFLAITGSVLTVTSLTLLMSCSFVGATESWALVLVAVFGVLQITVAVCTNRLWRQQLAKSLLVGGLALESYVTSALTDLCASLSTPFIGSDPANSSSDPSASTATLRDAYRIIFQQTCQPMKHWRLHVCVGDENASPHGTTHAGLFDSPACQSEFGALLRASADNALVLLSWMMAAQVAVLVWLLLPSAQSLLQSVVASVCCRPTTSTTNGRSMGKDLQKDDELAAHARSMQWKHATLDVSEARRLYLTTVKRNDAATLHAEAAAFDVEWTKMTGTTSGGGGGGGGGGGVIFAHQYQAIVRTLVLRRLTVNCKMDASLSVSRDGKQLLVRVFASDNLLMTTLCQSGASYPLQFADAIDPGELFWRDRRELKSDAKTLDAHTIHQKFTLLQLHGVVSRKDAELFACESLARASARVHALLRIHRWRSGVLRVANRHAPFVAYVPHAHLQYLYKRYPNRLDTAATAQHRRSAVLRTIDCLRLTRQLLDAEFDLDLMLRHGLLHAFTELHSASRFDATPREALLAAWVAFWAPRHLPGEAEPQSHWLRSQLARLSPFRQPLQDVRDYFGECIAFYFAWLAFYNQLLLVPTLAIGVLLVTRTVDTTPLEELAAFVRGRADTRQDAQALRYEMPASAVVLGLAVIAWGVAFAKLWARRSVWYQLEWGMSDREDAALADRANFRGVRRRHPVTQQLEVYFPGRERAKRQAATAVVVGAAGVAHVGVCLLLLLAQGVARQWVGLRLAVLLSGLAVALLVLWNGDAISALGHQLSEWENHQSERAFQRSVIRKVCVLQAFNSYGPLLLVAFALYRLDASTAPPLLRDWAAAFQSDVASHVGVVVQLQLLLLLIFGTRIASHLVLMAHGLVQHELSRGSGKGNSPPSTVESELELQAYRGSYEDYTEIVVQLGLVVMFSSVLPLAPALAFVECALELRLDALDLCLFMQRPTPETADGIGPWEASVRAVLQLGIAVHLALLYFMADNYAHWSGVRRAGAFLASVLIAWVASEVAWRVVPSQSRGVRDVRARHAFLVERYMGGEDGGDGVANGEGGGGGGGDPHAKNASLSDIERKALQLSGEEGSAEDEDRVETLATPAHYQERLALLRRLDTALRKHDETLEPEAALAPPRDSSADDDASPAAMGHAEAGVAIAEDGEGEERAVVGYFVRSERMPPTESSLPGPLPPLPPPPRPPVVVVSPPPEDPPPVVQQYARASLAGMEAIHTAAERQQFDFAQDHGWQADDTTRRGSLSSSLNRRFRLFQKRRQSAEEVATPPAVAASRPAPPPAGGGSRATARPAATSTTTTTTSASAAKRTVARPTEAKRSSSRDDVPLPVVQLSGLEAVHEAARRSQFDFSTDPWRDSADRASATL